MCGFRERIGTHRRRAKIRVEGVEVGKVRPRDRGTHVLEVCCEALVQPELAPVLHRDQIAEPLQGVKLSITTRTMP